MDVELNDIEMRVLGSLVEKEMTTPEYYPLSLNALTAACNQKSNRDPVMSVTEDQVALAAMSLKNKRLAWRLETAGGRVPKYEHNFSVHYSLASDEVAVLCTLLLRGPQTAGEIRQRASRMHEFKDISEVEATLQRLANHENDPFVVRLPRQPGRKENRYMHLFGGLIEPDSFDERQPEQTAAPAQTPSLREQVDSLRKDLDALRAEFEAFKSQLE